MMKDTGSTTDYYDYNETSAAAAAALLLVLVLLLLLLQVCFAVVSRRGAVSMMSTRLITITCLVTII